jgi:hypothetical protein
VTTSDTGAGREHGPETASDGVLVALGELLEAAEQVDAALRVLRARATQLHEARERAVPYRQLVAEEHRPLFAELLTDTIRRFEGAGTRFRQQEAKALRAEGMTMEQIAELFGLTRQRISALLRSSAS